jgi:hypothetical protein
VSAKGDLQDLSYADGSAKDGNEAGQEETDATGTEPTVWRGELEPDGSGECAQAVEGTHQIAARLEHAAEGGDQPTAGGEQGDYFDGGEADAFEEVKKIQQGRVGFIGRQNRLEFGHYGEKEGVLIGVPGIPPIQTILYCGKGRKRKGLQVIVSSNHLRRNVGVLQEQLGNGRCGWGLREGGFLPASGADTLSTGRVCAADGLSTENDDKDFTDLDDQRPFFARGRGRKPARCALAG